MNQLKQLKNFTTVVADSGDFKSIEKYTPTDSTTNPSLILLATQNPLYKHLIEESLSYAKKHSLVVVGQITHAVDKLLVLFAREILKVVPGRVSIELDPRLSYSTSQSIDKAKHIIYLLEKENIPRERILIKLAATWEGIQAAEILEKENIHCNMTLIFSLEQAALSAQAGATVISPFVGRILDWYKKKHSIEEYVSDKDPGVISVKTIYKYLKKFNYPTKIMGASFRNIDQIYQLVGCDLLTISPKFLDQLQHSQAPLNRMLSPQIIPRESIEQIKLDKKTFHIKLRENPMAFEKLHEGIQGFIKDLEKLEELIKNML